MQEHSPERTAWRKARGGMVTASRFADVLAKPRNKTAAISQAAESYLYELVYERLTGQPTDNVVSKAMQWGLDHEDEARQIYRWTTGHEIESGSLVRHPANVMVGGTPDALVKRSTSPQCGGLEIKCPYASREHVRLLDNPRVPAEYYPQVQGYMWILGRSWWDFASYDPRMPEPLAMVIITVDRDETFIKEMQEQILGFELRVTLVTERLKHATEL